MVVVGGLGYFDAGRELAGAFGAGEGGDVETAALEERFGHVASASSAGLQKVVSGGLYDFIVDSNSHQRWRCS